jgi:hypothetical protein
LLVDPALADAASNKFSDVLTYAKNGLEDLTTDRDTFSPASNKDLKKLIDKFEGHAGAEIPTVTSEGVEGMTLNPAETKISGGSPQDIFKATNDFKRDLDDLIKNTGRVTAQEKNTRGLLFNLRANVKNALEDPAVFGQAAARQAESNEALHNWLSAKDDLEKAFGIKSKSKFYDDRYTGLDPVKVQSRYLNQLGNLKGDAAQSIIDRFQQTSSDYVNDLQKSYASLPHREFDKEAVDNLLTHAKNQQKQATDAATMQQVFKRVGGGFGEGMNAGIGAGIAHAAGVPAPLIGAYEALKYPLKTMQVLAKFESAAQKTADVISKGAKSLFKGAEAVGDAGAGFAAGKLIQDNDPKSYQKRIDSINEHINSPELLMNKLASSTDSLHPHAPQNAQAIQNTAVAGLQFLKSKIPSGAPDTPLGQKIPPNQTDINKFNRYAEATENPTNVFKQMKAGMLNTETLETLKTIYPDLLGKMQSETFAALSAAKAKGQAISYSMKNQLSMFMGTPMDLSMAPSAIMSNQAAQNIAASQKQQQENQLGKPVRTTSKGLRELNPASRYMTPGQTRNTTKE